MKRNYVSPDVGAKRRAALLILAAIVLGVLVIYIVSLYVEDLKSLAGHDPELSFTKLKKFSTTLLVANAIVTTIFAIWFSIMAWKIWNNNRFPPPNVKVIRTTKILTGTRARIIALLCLIIALLLLSTNIFMWRFHEMIQGMNTKLTSMTEQKLMDHLASAKLCKERAIERFLFGTQGSRGKS